MSIFELLLLSIINLLGFRINSEPKNSLRRPESMRSKINRWAYIHQGELLLTITILMMVVFVLVAFAVVPPMDIWNNHLQEVI